MTDKYVMPGYGKNAFHCPHCSVYARQEWSTLSDLRRGPSVECSTCTHCDGNIQWYSEEQIWPRSAIGPRPNEDLGEDIISLYDEARDVGSLSPRSAAALLRLCAEMLVSRLCQEANINHKDLNDDIAKLVQNGLPVRIQQALDTLRVTGNEAVHPGQIDFEDDSGTVQSLFEFLNLIAHDRITQPKEIADRYSKLPQAKLRGIEDRDA